MFEMLPYDILRQQVPAFFYRRLEVAGGAGLKHYLNIPIAQGYVYLLREVSWRSSFYLAIDSVGVNDLRLEFVKSTRGRLLQNIPYPAGLISTPAYQFAPFSAAPAPVDNTAFSVNPDANPPLKNRLILNYLYQHKELIEVRWVNQGSGHVSWIDTLLCGYYIPEKSLSQWR